MELLIFFLVFFMGSSLYCFLFATFNYIYLLIFLDLLLLSLALLFLSVAFLTTNFALQNYALLLLGVGACETAVGLLLFIVMFKLQFFYEVF